MAASRKILFLTDWYPSADNPLQGIFIRETARAASLHHQVVVLHCRGAVQAGEGLFQFTEEKDPSLHHGIPTFRTGHRSVPLLGFPLFVLGIQRAFNHLTSSIGFQPDLLHAHIFHAGAAAVFIGKRYRIPVVISEHNSIFPRRLVNRKALIQARFAFQKAAVVLPVSSALQKAIEGYGISAGFHTLPNVVDTDIFFYNPGCQYETGETKLLAVALLDSSPNKGIADLLNACHIFNRDIDSWHLDIIGDGPARPRYEQMSRGLKLTEKVTFHGFKTKQEVAAFMRGAKLFILPSHKETFSVVAAESLCCGTPVLSTRCGGPEDFIQEGVNGVLVSPQKPQEMALTLVQLLTQWPNEFDASKIARQAAGLFSMGAVGDCLQEIYETILAG